jgi:hypothetical protein
VLRLVGLLAADSSPVGRSTWSLRATIHSLRYGRALIPSGRPTPTRAWRFTSLLR